MPGTVQKRRLLFHNDVFTATLLVRIVEDQDFHFSLLKNTTGRGDAGLSQAGLY
jgi:hypothetical protein